jgi:hypothetical protein
LPSIRTLKVASTCVVCVAQPRVKIVRVATMLIESALMHVVIGVNRESVLMDCLICIRRS